MRILAIDTALGRCSACVLDAGGAEPLTRESLPMARGHAEALLPLLDRVVGGAAGGFSGLDRVAVTVGPGSFTGLRVGISAARAVGLACGIPVVGVSTLSALMLPLVEAGPPRLTVAAVDARNGRVFAQAIGPSGRTVIEPAILGIREIVRLLGSSSVILAGSGARAVAAEALSVGVDARVDTGGEDPDIAWVARLGLAADPAAALPKPLYLAAPDARPQDEARLARR